MDYLSADITGAIVADQRARTPWPHGRDASTGSVDADCWRWLLTHSGTGSNVLGGPELHEHSERTAADNLRRVLEILKPSIKDLASLFHVSRQTIYNWLNGDEPKADLAERLTALAMVADIVAAENLADRSSLLKRAGSGGQSLWDVLKGGGDAVELAKQLMQVANVERINMQKFNERLAYRRRGDNGGELMPRLDETP